MGISKWHSLIFPSSPRYYYNIYNKLTSALKKKFDIRDGGGRRGGSRHCRIFPTYCCFAPLPDRPLVTFHMRRTPYTEYHSGLETILRPVTCIVQSFFVTPLSQTVFERTRIHAGMYHHHDYYICVVIYLHGYMVYNMYITAGERCTYTYTLVLASCTHTQFRDR